MEKSGIRSISRTPSRNTSTDGESAFCGQHEQQPGRAGSPRAFMFSFLAQQPARSGLRAGVESSVAYRQQLKDASS